MTEFYGDNFRWFMGVVEEVGNDQPKLGRVKVRIFGIHGNRAEVPISDLPYAQVLIPTTEPGVSGLGRNPLLSEGATVFGLFLDGKSAQLPLVLGSIPTIEIPSVQQINSESPSPAFLDAVKREQGTKIPGKAGTGTGGQAGIRSTYAGGYDSFQYDATKVGSNTAIAWDFLMGTGKYNQAVVAGIIGNLLVESGSGSPVDIKTTALGDSGKSIGIAQWYNGTPRQQKLREFADKQGKPIDDLYVQLQYIDYELSNESYYRGNELKQKKTPTEAAIHFQRYYEIPALTGTKSPIDGKPMRLHEDRRVAYAKQIYNLFTRKVVA